MPSAEVHRQKYEDFRADAEREENSIPIRIEAYFHSLFHLIELVVVQWGIHINQHQFVRRELEGHPEIFGERTRPVWEGFQEIENRIRPGQVYGGRVNGENLRRTQEIYAQVEAICLEVLRERED
jgi:hypothetical protein